MTIIDACRDRALFGAWFFSSSWAAWLAFLAALFGLDLDDAGLDLYRRCTSRTTAPTAPAREGWVIVGRRGGKSRIAALIAVYLACFRDYRSMLSPGEVATVMVIAADRRQARVVFRYVRAFLRDVPMLARMIESETRESITLNNGASIEIHTASYRSTRGYTCAAVIADECAFWPTDEAGANPDVEILAALRPSLATLPGAMLLAISSPYARRGALWQAYRRHHGVDGSPVLTWQADTATMNPCVDAQVIADAYAEDEAAASAEYGAEFRRDVESFVSAEAIDGVTIPGRLELPPTTEHRFFAFTDPAGGSGADSFTLAIAHRDKDGLAVLDLAREIRPPFSPEAAAEEFAKVLRQYGCTSVTGDRYAGEWPRERFRKHGITYQLSDRPKSDIYRDALPLLTSGKAELLDLARLRSQLLGLERRTSRAGKDSIDSGPRGHEDLANSACGALVGVEHANRNTIESHDIW